MFVGRFAEARAALDYTWHSYYTPERQAVQVGGASWYRQAVQVRGSARGRRL